MPRDHKNWSDEDIKAARRLHDEQDYTWAEVGERFGVSGDAARKAVRSRGNSTQDEKSDAYASVDRRRQLRQMFPNIELPEDVDWREHLTSWEERLDIHKRIDPTQEHLVVDLSLTDQPIGVVMAADLHLGGGYTNYGEIRKTMEFILDNDGLYLGITGDSIEGFIPGEKSAETVEQMPSSLKEQLSALKSLISELTDNDKLMWLTWGDHDAKWFEKLIGLNVVKQMIHDRSPYFTGRGLVEIKLGEQTYYMLVNHSERFHSQWSDTHPARRAYERIFPADVVVTAHKHRPEWRVMWHYEQLEEAGLDVGGKAILVQCGTWKSGPDPYTIRRWRKGVMGVPTVVLWPDQRRKEILESPELALSLIDSLTS